MSSVDFAARTTARARSHQGNIYVTNQHHLAGVEDVEPQKSLAPDWIGCKTVDGETYYVHSQTCQTKWIGPTKDLLRKDESFRTKLETEFKSQLLEQTDRSNTGPQAQSSPADKKAPKPRYSVFSAGECVIETNDDPAPVVRKLDELSESGQDCVFLIENINRKGIEDMRSLKIPTEYMDRRTANTLRDTRSVWTSTCLQTIDDRVESAQFIGQSLGTRDAGKAKSRKLQVVEDVLDLLWKTSLVVKTTIEDWNMSGAHTEDLDCVSSYAAELQRTLDGLRSEAASINDPYNSHNKDNLETLLGALWKQMRNMSLLRRRRYFQMSAKLVYDEGATHDDLVREALLSRENPQLSLIRVNQSICIVLVNSGPIGRARLKFPQANAGNGLTIPKLLESPEFSIYSLLQVFAREAWHAEVLCGEDSLPPTYDDHLASSADPSNPRPSKRFAAMDPQAFLVMLSSFLWEKNLGRLEKQISTISFRRLRDAMTMLEMDEINVVLHDSRENLAQLVLEVEHTQRHVPIHLNDYFDSFPRIKRRHNATHLSPVEHLGELLRRAGKLDKLILDTFQILMSSVSVREGHESVKQTRVSTEQTAVSTKQSKLAILITVLAFVYVPLTLVTGIFGMNVIGSDAFVWWAPLAALAAVVVLTAALCFAAWIWFRRSNETKNPDVENGHMEKDKKT